MHSHFHKNTDLFQNEIALKFQLYNSLFLSLPFVKVEKTGILISMLHAQCEDGYDKGLHAPDIIQSFFRNYTTLQTDAEKIDFLFRAIQYIERQVVLFDALEDAAYAKINDLFGPGTMKAIESKFEEKQLSFDEKRQLDDFTVRLVLTAHPTQFYPGSVLGIINDLTESLKLNDTQSINKLLQQLGKTPFLNQKKPTPYDEAISLIWFLENVFYHTIGKIMASNKDNLPFMDPKLRPIIRMGFWPGGDRDGNPYVTASTTMSVANALHIAILKCYYRDIRNLKRRLTFRNVDTIIAKMESDLYEEAFLRKQDILCTIDDLIHPLENIKEILISEHDGLFVHKVEELINKIYCFGMHFAFVDIRQENEIHSKLISTILNQKSNDLSLYQEWPEDKKIEYLTASTIKIEAQELDDDIESDTILTMQTVRKIQEMYGEAACHRYIISQCSSALNVMEVLTLFRMAGWPQDQINVDIVPLFETIDDLIQAPIVMKKLYELAEYKRHLTRRNHKQTIMLGFSDGTKDGGYLMANWMIYKAKEELSKLSKNYGIDVMFFDGRGGPPARGGGKTHKFYASMDKDISTREIQLTIQGQTISSNFGILDSAQYNIEQLINAGINNNIFPDAKNNFSADEEALIYDIAQISLNAYLDLKNHPDFVTYMSDVSPLKYFGQTNIGSRPAKRGKTDKLTIKDLRAIPFVASWNMIKQNVPGFYGLGTAIEQIKSDGKFEQLKAIYQKSLFFRTLMDNSEMTLFKTFLPVTNHVELHPVYGNIRKKIADEYQLTKKNLLALGEHEVLMQEYPIDSLSVQMREQIVLPLVTIQQYALAKLRDISETSDPTLQSSYEKIVVRSAFGIINAGRNSA